MHADCIFEGSVFGQKELTNKYMDLFKNINMEK